jgi:peptidoglycan-associated lipoprotein
VVGCATTKQAVVAPAATVAAAPAAKPGSVEVAAEDVREALLQLQRVHFAFDSDALLPSTQAALADAAARIGGYGDIALYIDGHTDERGTSEYNLALGEQRARSVRNYLARLGIAADRLHVVSFGEEQPLAMGHEAIDHAQNRRADFRLMRGSVRLVLDDGTPVDDQGMPVADGAGGASSRRARGAGR